MKTYNLITIFANTLGPNERVICEHFVLLIKLPSIKIVYKHKHMP